MRALKADIEGDRVMPCYIRHKIRRRDRRMNALFNGIAGTEMPALDLDTHADQIAERMANADTLLVACLCAEWCGTCRDYRAGFDRLADAYPDICFAWIDIENQADRFDDLDVENFPTILIEDANTTRFFGTVLPQPSIVARMLTDLGALPGVAGAPKVRPALVAA